VPAHMSVARLHRPSALAWHRWDMAPDLGATLRDWLNARDLRRWRRRGSLPPTLDRTYWTAYEYGRDLGRLQASGYRVTLERVSTPYPDLTPNVTPAGPRRVRAQVRRVSRYRVSYERLAYSTWASALPVAPES